MHVITHLIIPFLIMTTACRNSQSQSQTPISLNSGRIEVLDSVPNISNFALKISEAALSLTQDQVVYDPAYFTIKYPNGDVPPDKGVCTDVVIRTYRKVGIDLQKEVHEDMVKNFNIYPKKWGLKKTDTHIDHRRVPNLMTFFSRKGEKKTISNNPQDYQPSDIVTWNLEGNLTHIGIVTHIKSADKKRYLIVHNIGRGQELADCLFAYTITGHYSYK